MRKLFKAKMYKNKKKYDTKVGCRHTGVGWVQDEFKTVVLDVTKRENQISSILHPRPVTQKIKCNTFVY